MKHLRWKAALAALLTIMSVGVLAPAASASPPPGCTSTNGTDQNVRCAGNTRVATQTTVAQQFAAIYGSNVPAIVITSSETYADALACGALAARWKGPLLVTPQAGLDPLVASTMQQLSSARNANVFLCGGSSALSPTVGANIRSLGFNNVFSFTGNDRFETAVLVANASGNNPYVIVEADGTNFQDALTGAYIAAKDGGVLLLTNGTAQPAVNTGYISRFPNLRRVTVGGAAKAADPGATEKFDAGDPFSTSQAAAQRWAGSYRDIVVVSGDNWVDALGAVPLALRNMPGNPAQVLFVGASYVPQRTYDWVVERRRTLGKLNIQIIGGPAAVSDSVAAQLVTANA